MNENYWLCLNHVYSTYYYHFIKQRREYQRIGHAGSQSAQSGPCTYTIMPDDAQMMPSEIPPPGKSKTCYSILKCFYQNSIKDEIVVDNFTRINHYK